MNFKIEIEQLTPWSLVYDLARETMGLEPSNMNPTSAWKRKILHCEHSPIRAMLYKVRMVGIPYWVSVHFVRHKYGVEHFVSTQRTDRTGEDRECKRQDAPVNHTMVVNAAELIFISRRRLCNKASAETREVWNAVRKEMAKIDPEMAGAMVAECKYRNICPEMRPCGMAGVAR